MKRYAYIEKGRVREVIFDFVEDFEDIPAVKRYSSKFIKKCIVVDDDNIKVVEGMDYIERENIFKEHVEEITEVNSEESVEVNSEESVEGEMENGEQEG